MGFEVLGFEVLGLRGFAVLGSGCSGLSWGLGLLGLADWGLSTAKA